MSGDGKNEIIGLVLAGGQSRRMGGGHKGLLELAGKPMIRHVLDRLAPQVGQLLISINDDAAAFQQFGIPLIGDDVYAGAGPLAGLLAGMDWAKANRPDAHWLVSATCDAPFFPQDLVERLLGAIRTGESGGPQIAVAASAGRGHFGFGLWPVTLREDLRTYLASGQRKVQHWIERHVHISVEFPSRTADGVAVDPFFNVNDPDEFAAAEQFLAGPCANRG